MKYFRRKGDKKIAAGVIAGTLALSGVMAIGTAPHASAHTGCHLGTHKDSWWSGSWTWLLVSGRPPGHVGPYLRTFHGYDPIVVEMAKAQGKRLSSFHPQKVRRHWC